MSKLKSKEDFLAKLAELKKTQTDPELIKFLEQVYASKLYYDYYIRFMDGHHIATIKQFAKLIKNPKATKTQLRAALEISLSDIEDLWMKVEDFQQDEDHRISVREDEFFDKHNSIYGIKFIGWLNLIAILAVGLVVLFK